MHGARRRRQRREPQRRKGRIGAVKVHGAARVAHGHNAVRGRQRGQIELLLVGREPPAAPKIPQADDLVAVRG